MSLPTELTDTRADSLELEEEVGLRDDEPTHDIRHWERQNSYSRRRQEETQHNFKLLAIINHYKTDLAR